MTQFSWVGRNTRNKNFYGMQRELSLKLSFLEEYNIKQIKTFSKQWNRQGT